jgi:HSP20 family protein
MPDVPFTRGIPFSLQDLRSEFDRMLDRVWHVGLSTAPLDGRDWAPAVDVIEENTGYLVRVEVPGLSAGDVEVSILDKTLTVKGVKPAQVKPEEPPHYLRKECRYGMFCRSYELPAPVESEGVKAACKNGVLEITIPKRPEAQGRPVKVQSQDIP